MDKSNNGKIILGFVIGLLVMAVIGMAGYIIYDKNNNKVNDNNQLENNNNINDENNSSIKEEIKVEDLNINSDLINMIIKKISYFNTIEFTHSEMGKSGNLFGILYKKDKLLIKDLPADIRMDYVISSFDLENEAEFDGVNKYTIYNDKFKEKYIELMGKNVNLELVSYDWKCPNPTFEDDNIIIMMGCGGTWGPAYQIYKKYIRAEKVNNEIYLYEKIAVVDQNSLDEFNKLDVYSDLEHNNLVANNVEETEKEIFSSKYIDKYLEYKYTFKLEDGNYIFYSIEKIK